MAKTAGKLTARVSELSQFIESESIGANLSESDLSEFAELAIDRIVNRTLDGVDLSGKAFQRYTEDYAEYKGVTVNSVDLQLTGDMLSAVRSTVTSKGVLLYLDSRQTPKGFNHQVGDTLPRRPWFGLTRDELDEISSRFKGKEKKEEEVKTTVTLADIMKAASLLGVKLDG